ncbi:hypothetical protein PR048_013591 [Dryococelus australis]|uniref:Uncharacterized protein n=1 Tax=Dryococelus australis TaxID=614101 RepID=A0ABQ9HTG8_9NEOP|nr:hypothetical protein PR048_013591 [Dryococelus australis]
MSSRSAISKVIGFSTLTFHRQRAVTSHTESKKHLKIAGRVTSSILLAAFCSINNLIVNHHLKLDAIVWREVVTKA